MATFVSKFLPDGSTSLVCRETGETYLIGPSDVHGMTYGYREGEFLTYAPRLQVAHAIESDANWAMRVSEARRLALHPVA